MGVAPLLAFLLPSVGDLRPVLAGALTRVLMAVGRLNNLVVVPCIGVGIIREVLEASQRAVGIDAAIEDTIDNGYRLSSYDRPVGTEGTILITVDPAIGRSRHDALVGPMAAAHIGETVGYWRRIEESHKDRHEFRSRDRLLAAEGAVGIAGDVSALRHGGNIGIVPFAAVHVGEAVRRCVDFTFSGIGEQAVNHRGALGTGDVLSALCLLTDCFLQS